MSSHHRNKNSLDPQPVCLCPTEEKERQRELLTFPVLQIQANIPFSQDLGKHLECRDGMFTISAEVPFCKNSRTILNWHRVLMWKCPDTFAGSMLQPLWECLEVVDQRADLALTSSPQDNSLFFCLLIQDRNVLYIPNILPNIFGIQVPNKTFEFLNTLSFCMELHFLG